MNCAFVALQTRIGLQKLDRPKQTRKRVPPPEKAAHDRLVAERDTAIGEFIGEFPATDAAELSRRWHAIVAEAREIIACLPPEHAGTCVVSAAGELVRYEPEGLTKAVAEGRLRFHAGSVRGALPSIR